MESAKFIAINEFCSCWDIDVLFVNSLQEKGLIELVVMQETTLIDTGQLVQLEKLVRFHYEMEINLEGIETIVHLLQRVDLMQGQIVNLGNRLSLYEKKSDYSPDFHEDDFIK